MFTKDWFDSKQDFSGYDVESWTPRDPERHKGKATEASNATARNYIESSYGARYSELFRLLYYHVVCHHVVDPMHNLFLGIAKHTINTWKKLSILKDGDFYVIQERVIHLFLLQELAAYQERLVQRFHLSLQMNGNIGNFFIQCMYQIMMYTINIGVCL